MSSESRLGGPRTTSKSLAPQVNCAEGPTLEEFRYSYFRRVSIERRCGALVDFSVSTGSELWTVVLCERAIGAAQWPIYVCEKVRVSCLKRVDSTG